jgi:hypothetical protein
MIFAPLLLAPSVTVPIAVTSCAMVEQPSAARRGPVQETLRVSYQLDSPVAADAVTFVVRRHENGAVRSFTARGLFTRGALIADRILQLDEGSPSSLAPTGAPGDECRPVYVHFVDGTTWQPDAANAEHRRNSAG